MLHFHKLHSFGNDFILLEQPETFPTDEQIRRWGNRYLGIGFDQCLVITKLSKDEWRYQIFNQDGHEVSQCLNGARAVGLYLNHTRGLERVTLHSNTEEIVVKIAHHQDIEILVKWPRETQKMFEGWFYELGNPHWVIDLTHQRWERQMISDYYLQKPVNVSGVYRHHEREVSLCTYERGVGFTNACGSAAVATFTALYEHQLCDDHLTVFQKGGASRLYIHQDKVCAVGQAKWVYSGEIDLAQQVFNQGPSTQNRYHGFKEIL